MWFMFALLTALSWGAADLFYKKGSNPDDKYSHLKIVIMVGIIMGIHATGYMLLNGLSFDPIDLIKYLPVSAMYILSMAIGYFGLRYIELSVSSPIQNSSGAITTILLFIFFTHSLSSLEVFGIIIITLGVIGLAILEKRAENELLKTSSILIEKKYQFGVVAILFPILYALIDGLGTFLDGIYLDEMSLISEDAALIAYEYTFLIVAAVAYLYLKVKKEPFNAFKERTRATAAIFETTGQFFYVFAMAKNAIIAAPIIASYSIFSVLLSRLILKEKMTKSQYIVIIIVILGIALLGIADEL